MIYHYHLNDEREKVWYDTKSTSLNTIQKISSIEQGGLVDIFGRTSMSFTTTPNIPSFGGRVVGMGPTYNYSITTNSIALKIQQSTALNLVMG